MSGGVANPPRHRRPGAQAGARVRARARASTPALALILLLAGCTLGPTFTRPAAPAASAYLPPAEQAETPPAKGTIVMQPGAPVLTQWWRSFDSPALDRILAQALFGSQTLAGARQRLIQARETAVANLEQPAAELDLSATISNHPLTVAQFQSQKGNFNLYAIGAQVSYSPDIFGAVRRTQENLGALTDYARFEYEAAQLSVAGNAAEGAIAAASFTAQAATAARIAAIDRQRLDLARAFVQVGKSPRAQLAGYEADLARSEAAILPLRQQEEASQHVLAALCGVPPALWTLPVPRLSDLAAPAHLPLTLPSALLRQRPDIQAAEALAHAASASVGVATAGLYPSLTISASTLLSLGGDIAEPLFNWQSLHAAKRASEAGLQAALADYRRTVLEAFAQVATMLQAIQYDEAMLGGLDRQQQTAADHLALIRTEHDIGRLADMPLLEAERASLSLDLDQITAKAALDHDIVELDLAMGGGVLPAGGAAGIPPASTASSLQPAPETNR